MEEPTPDWNSFDQETFEAHLVVMEYEELEALYEKVDPYHKTLILRRQARVINDFIAKKDSLASLSEIQTYVKLLPLYLERMRRIKLLTEQFKATHSNAATAQANP